MCVPARPPVCSYAARFIAEYVDKTVGKDVLNVGEYWTGAEGLGVGWGVDTNPD